MKKMKLAVLFAALVSVFTFSSCLNSDGDSRRSGSAIVTVTGDEYLGYKLYVDHGGILIPTAASMKQIDLKGAKRLLVGFYYLDDPIPEFSETTKYNVEIMPQYSQRLFGGSAIIDRYNNQGLMENDTLTNNQDLIYDLSVSAYRGFVTAGVSVNYDYSKPVYFNMGYDSSKDIDVENKTLNLTLYYDNGKDNDNIYNRQSTTCSFPLPSEAYSKFSGIDSIYVNVKAISDRNGGIIEKKYKISTSKDFFPPTGY